MKQLLPTTLLFFLFTCLVACGEEEPVPTLPPGAEDTTEVDTVVPDTIPTDTTEVDTDNAKRLNFFYSGEECPPFGVKCDLPGKVYKHYYDVHGKETDIMSLKPHEVYLITVGADGYITQSVEARNNSQLMPFVLQRIPKSGRRVSEVENCDGDMQFASSQESESSTGLRATMRIAGGSKVENAGERDSVAIVPYLPAAYAISREPAEGELITGAVAGVAVTPLGAYFPDGVECSLTLPMSAEGYSLSMSSSDDEGSVEISGSELYFGSMRGAEWMVLMDARLVSIGQEEIYLVKDQQERSDAKKVEVQGKMVCQLPISHRVAFSGYVKESDLNFMEERFLTSLYGIYAENLGVNYVCYGNHPFAISYNIKQTVYHLTFEAAGRRFRAKVYGDFKLEVTEKHIME